MNKIISPIAIDMGAKNTGVYLNHFEQGEDPTTSGNTQGKTIVMDSINITWSQESRTQKRHQIRASKRRKLSKRLLKLVLDEYNIKPDLKQKEYLNGLLNRRGYTYLVEGLDENLIKQGFVADYFIKKHKGFFKNKDSFYADFIAISNNIEQAEALKEALTLSKNEAKNEIEDKENKKEFADAYDNIKLVLSTQIKAKYEGHKYRTIYLENIKKDIASSTLLKSLFNDINVEKLANLIGNISNLQLRVLRKYFNDENMKSGDIWLPEKLQTVFFKWVRSWHTKDNEKQNRTEILKLKGNSNILDILTTLNPKKTIPPYEDQNNRRPPKDLTLKLKPKGLDKYLENWTLTTQLLADNYILPSIDEHITEQIDIQEGLQDNSRPQKDKGKDTDTKKRQILADTLHRILDRTIILDPYKLRWLAQGSDTKDTKAAKNLLNQHSNNQADKIIILAKKYYAEVEVAKQGLWSSKDENSLFFRCNTNPPHKGKLTHKLVGHILRKPFTKEAVEDFRKNCWQTKIGRSTVKGLAGKIEETRKEYGNGFNYIVQTIKKRQWVKANESPSAEQIARWDKYENDYKNVVEAIKNTELVAEKINHFLKHNNKEKYNNPFSIAQLYNHLESEISGFSKTDKFNTEENAWRDKEHTTTILNKSGENVKITRSNAMRLTADSIRPFDGLLDRIISRQAYEISSEKIKQIKALNIDKNDTLFVPIFMEQNRFKFEQDMAEIKSNTKKKENAKKGLEKQTKQWKDKNNRIKKNTFCPYTGGQIGNGEIDHIIPQSQSKKNQDVVFNSEANLIYCSGTGNHQKGDNRWTFERLKPNYLKEVFGNETNIKQNIITFINGLNENDSISFHNLEEKEQNYLRHALFIPELDSKTFPLLNTRYKTFVNGTQGYLGKQIRKLLQNEYPNIQVKTYQIPAQEVSQLRIVLGDYDVSFKKQDRQGAFSHVVDASLVLATALQNQKIAEELTTINVAKLTEKGQWLKDLLPENAPVQHIKRKPKYRKNLASTQIFKDGLYGERFMPILLNDEKLYYGFALDNCIEIKKNKNQGFETLEEYFELLKPFLYTGKKNDKAPVSGDLTQNWKYNYWSIDKTKALNHLQKCAKEVCGDVEIKQAQQLEKLRYSIEKKEIEGFLLTDKKIFISGLNDKKFTVSKLTLPAKTQWEALINCPIKDYAGKKTTLKKCFGQPEQIEIDNPNMASFWQDLAKQSSLDIAYLQKHLFKRNEKEELAKKSGVIPKGVFDQKIKTEEKLKALENNSLLKKSFGIEFKTTTDFIPQKSWDELFKAFFHTGKVENNSQHKQVRKKYSLPIVSNPSGGFRIKRKNPLTNETIYQVSSIEGFATKGYDETLKKPVLIDKLNDSPNIASLDGKQTEVDNVCYFDEWRQITIPENLNNNLTSLSYAIGSKDRFNIKVSMSIIKFKELDKSIKYFSDISAEYKETDTWKFKKTKLFASDLLGKPRSNLFVEFVSENTIIFSYIVDSTSKAMKEAYQQGTPIK